MRKTYKSYKNSGVDWIGEIPSHWLLRKLKHNTYIKARVGWHGLKSTEFKDEGPYCVTGTDFIDGRIQWEGCYRVSKERYDEDPYIQLKEDDLLITKDGTIGKTAVVRNLPGPCTLNSGVFVVRPEADYTSKYLYWVLNSSIFTEFVNFYSKGSTIIHLYQDTFCNLPQPIPSLEEQYKISDYLDEKTALIDSTIRKKEKLIELLQEERTAIINQAVTRGLDPNVKMKDSGVEWLEEIPEHWEYQKLKFLTSEIGDGLHATPEYSDEGSFFFINGTNLSSGKIDISHARTVNQEEFEKYKKLVPAGTILLSLNGTIGKLAYYNNEAVIFGKSVAFVVPSEKVSNHFLYFFLKSTPVVNYFEESLSGTTIRNLSLHTLRNTPIWLPPLEEQQNIAKHIQFFLNTVENAEVLIKKELNLLNEYRVSLINNVVTGKHCVI